MLELKQALYFRFSQYGEILEISAKKNIRMRGQAFIAFKDISSAKTAMKELQGHMFFNKPMVIMNFAPWSLENKFC